MTYKKQVTIAKGIAFPLALWALWVLSHGPEQLKGYAAIFIIGVVLFFIGLELQKRGM